MTSRRLLALLVAALGLAVLFACSEQPPRFSHEIHLTRIACGTPGRPRCLSCATCHQLPATGGRLTLPEASVCSRCHQPKGASVLAAIELPEEPPEELARTIRFSHKQHLAMPDVNGQCVTCHAGVVNASAGEPFPAMQRCFSCHEHEKQWQARQCEPCHARSDLRRLMPQTFLRHDQGFWRRHGTLARQQSSLCETCHSQAQCDECHDTSQNLTLSERRPEAIDMRFVHRGDFMVRHAIEARSDPARCLRCHSEESCNQCHVQRGVAANAVNGANPHPPGWMGPDTNSPNFHGQAARRDIVACASCHDQGPATNCIPCHKVGGVGGNPHPHGWKSSRSVASTMCRYCHG
jgi:Cytochrome c7 and related cytochrome c